MQERKYRAWLKEEKRMVTVVDLKFLSDHYGNEKEIVYWDDNINSSNYAYWDEIELMEYIRKKDTNNVEIYEGDIVIYAINSVSGYCEATGIVKYNKETCAYEVEDIEDIDCTEFVGYCEEIEVIGNIYQNPELLEFDDDDCKDFKIIDEDFGLLLDQLIDPLKP